MKTRSSVSPGLSNFAAAALVACVAATAALAATLPPETVLPDQSPADMVGALHTAFGEHHARAVHAKGIILVGEFVPDAGAKSLTRASIFATPGRLPLTLRFSDFTGIPDIPDTVGDANPRGLAFKIVGANGEAFDVVTHRVCRRTRTAVTTRSRRHVSSRASWRGSTSGRSTSSPTTSATWSVTRSRRSIPSE
jgi:hypothetical protein